MSRKRNRVKSNLDKLREKIAELPVTGKAKKAIVSEPGNLGNSLK